MRREASDNHKPAWSTKSLLQRLAALENAGAPPVDPGHGPLPAEQLATKSHRRALRTYFGLGIASSGIVGIALLVLVFVNPESARINALWSIAEARAALAPAWFGLGRENVARQETTRAFDIPVLRGAGRVGIAPFRLPFIDVGSGANDVTILFLDVPEQTWLSNGERQDGKTWALRPSDLSNLHLFVNEATPESFDVTILLQQGGGEARIAGLARVRLIDEPEGVSTLRLASHTSSPDGRQLWWRLPQ